MCSAWVRMHFVGSSTLTRHSAKSSVAGIVGPGRCPPLLYSLMSSPRQLLPLLGAIDPALGQPRRLCAAASLHATHPCTALGLVRQPPRGPSVCRGLQSTRPAIPGVRTHSSV